ncbi:MAG TPA: DUF5682 family protein [Kofleriaceae bacterium]
MKAAFFPVRHHSPRASAALSSFLDRVKPTLVLVEGPRDAMKLISYLFDADTEPPVAILGYRTDGPANSLLYPFATYSPEYVAMAWAQEHGVAVELIDITTGEALAAKTFDETPETTDDDTPPSEDAPLMSEAELAKQHGFRSFEELWEAWFEAPDHDPDQFVSAMIAWADVMRAQHPSSYHRARDSRMARHINDAIARGVPADKIAVVLGAAHVAALVVDDFEPDADKRFVASVPTEVTLIPYSFTRLAGQVGYGAGNRAPRYYQKAHDAGCDYTRATLEVLVEFTEHLRVRGFSASLADTIEAYRLAVTLAKIRDKHAPGLDEVRDATIATLCRGDASYIDDFLWTTVVGKTVGRVGQRIGKNSLQTEFWREVEARGLPRSDEPEQFTLKLADAVQAQTSVFLHRLRVADVPYAAYMGSQTISRQGTPSGEDAGGIEALSRVREHWNAQWTPSTDVALVERIIYGDTLTQVVERRLSEALAAVTQASLAAHVLMEAVVTGAGRVVPEALAATERLAAVDDDVASLARATRSLSGLVSYGTSRASIAGAEAVVLDLAGRTFVRAVLRIEGAATGSDEAVAPTREAIRILHEIAVSQKGFDTTLWFQTAESLVHSGTIHGAVAGMLAGLLYLAERIDESLLETLVGLRLTAIDPSAGAAFLEGFLSVNSLVLVKNRAVVTALDQFLQGVPDDRFRDVLPMLRRAFSGLGATERRYLLENLLSARTIGPHANAAKQVLASKDIEKLKEMSADIAAAMDDLDDLL